MSQKPKVFIGSSREGLDIAKAIQLGLERVANVVLWTQGALEPMQPVTTELIHKARQFDFAVLVLTPDDRVCKRGETEDAPRDNVVFELGLFIGTLGLDRVFFIRDRESTMHLPTDLAGVTELTYAVSEGCHLEAALGPVCTRIEKRLSSWDCGVQNDHSVDLDEAGVALSLQQPVASAVGQCQITTWAEVLNILSRARTRIDLLQTWVPWLRTEEECWVRALREADVVMRILLIDPSLASYRTAYRDKDSGHLLPTVSKIRDLAALYNVEDDLRIQGRFYSCLPFGPLYIVDDVAFWGLYYAHCDSLLGPAFSCDRASPLGQMLQASFDRTWERGRCKSGLLTLPGPPEATAADAAETSGELVRGMAASLYGRLAQCDTDSLGSPSASGLLVALRHAETQLNASGIFSGDLDVGISAEGITKARSLWDTLNQVRWDHIYCSTLQRSRDTLLHALGKNVAPAILDRDELRERRMGDVEGLRKSTYKHDRQHYALANADLVGSPFVSALGGESYVDVAVRLFPFLQQLVQLAEYGQNVLICTHETPLRLIRMFFEGATLEEAPVMEIRNAQLYVYQAGRHGTRIT